MIDYLSSPVIHEAFFKKYASKKFLKGTVTLFFSESMTDKRVASIVLRRWAKEYVAEYGPTIPREPLKDTTNVKETTAKTRK
jgi:G2/mitotic-specific cyclin 1/2